jgi:hypothetical protein
MKRFFFVVCVLTVLAAGAQTVDPVALEQAKRFLQAEREQIFIQTLQLSVSQAAVFHPIFVDYNREKKGLDDLLIKKFLTYAENYATMTPRMMADFIRDTRRVQRRDLRLRKKFYRRLRKNISNEIAIQFYEVDDLISTTLRLNVLSSLPFLSAAMQQQP